MNHFDMKKFNIEKREDLAGIINGLGLKRGIEIGVSNGDFSEFLLENTNLELLHGVDAYCDDMVATGWATKKRDRSGRKLEKTFLGAQKRFSKYGSRYELHRGFSDDPKILELFEDQSLDFIYVDAAHRFWGVARDLQNYWPKLRWGGLFAGHDYWHSYRCEVVYAVNGFVTENRQLLNVTYADRPGRKYPPTWWLIKSDFDKGEYRNGVNSHRDELMRQMNILKSRNVRVDIPDDYLH